MIKGYGNMANKSNLKEKTYKTNLYFSSKELDISIHFHINFHVTAIILLGGQTFQQKMCDAYMLMVGTSTGDLRN